VVGIVSRQDLLKVRSTQERGEKLRSRQPLPIIDSRR
jgi:hypothetical protein